MASFDLADYRRRAEEFTGALDLEAYQHFAGLKADCDFTAVYDRYPELFTLDAVRTLRGPLRRRHRRRRAPPALVPAQPRHRRVSGQRDQRALRRDRQHRIARQDHVDGEQIGLRYSSVVQANEPDRDAPAPHPRRPPRAHEQRSSTRSTTRRWRRQHELVGELGYPTYSELFSEVRAVDFGMLRGATQTFLQATEGLYQRTLDKVARAKLGLSRSELEQSDLPYLVRAPEYDHIFASDKLLPTFERTLRGLGVDARRHSPTCTSTPKSRELKSPRAFCAPVRIPDEIYLVVMPKGGQDDYQALLHEGGHTEHFAHTDPDLPFEFRFLGDNAVTEGFAFVFDHLIAQPALARDLPRLRRLAATTSPSPTWSSSTSCAATPASSPTRPSSMCRPGRSTPWPGATAPCSARPSRSTCRPRATWSTSTTASTPPTTCAPGCSRGRCACCCKTTTAWSGSSTQRPASGSRSCGRRGSMYSADQLLLKNGGGRLDTRPLELHLERALGR